MSVISVIISILFGFLLGAIVVSNKLDEDLRKSENLAEKHLALFLLMNKWVRIQQEKKSILNYFTKNQYKSVIVYGLNYVGMRLIDELRESEVEIVCGIDQRDLFVDGINVINPDSEIPDTDIMIITPYTFYDEIKRKMMKSTNCAFLSIDELLDEVDSME